MQFFFNIYCYVLQIILNNDHLQHTHTKKNTLNYEFIIAKYLTFLTECTCYMQLQLLKPIETYTELLAHFLCS